MDPETPDAPADPNATPVAPPVTFVPSDDFKRFQETIAGTLTGIQDAMSQISKSVGVAARPAAPVARVTDDEIESAVRTGEGTAAVLRRFIAEAGSDLVRTQIDPLRETGLSAVQGVVQETVKGYMPHYDKFKKEIDEYIAAMPAEARLNPKVYIMAHNAVVGMHHDELVKEATEAAIRQASEPKKPDPAPGSRSGRTAGAAAGGIPDPEDVFGREAMDALDSLGRTPDQHAKSLGYKDYKDYYEKAIKEPAV